jgi:hypothetical protein
MSVVSIICTVKEFLKVAAADEVPFVHDDGTIGCDSVSWIWI